MTGIKQGNKALIEHLASITDRIIKDSVFSDVEEDEEKSGTACHDQDGLIDINLKSCPKQSAGFIFVS